MRVDLKRHISFCIRRFCQLQVVSAFVQYIKSFVLQLMIYIYICNTGQYILSLSANGHTSALMKYLDYTLDFELHC